MNFSFTLLATILVVMGCTMSAPVSESLTANDRQRLGDILDKLDNTLTDLTTFLKRESSIDNQQVEDISKELPDLVDNFRQSHHSNDNDKQSREKSTSEQDDDSDATSLKDVLRYLVQLQQHKSRSSPSAVKRDHDIPFPIDGTFSYDFRD